MQGDSHTALLAPAPESPTSVRSTDWQVVRQEQGMPTVRVRFLPWFPLPGRENPEYSKAPLSLACPISGSPTPTSAGCPAPIDSDMPYDLEEGNTSETKSVAEYEDDTSQDPAINATVATVGAAAPVGPQPPCPPIPVIVMTEEPHEPKSPAQKRGLVGQRDHLSPVSAVLLPQRSATPDEQSIFAWIYISTVIVLFIMHFLWVNMLNVDCQRRMAAFQEDAAAAWHHVDECWSVVWALSFEPYTCLGHANLLQKCTSPNQVTLQYTTRVQSPDDGSWVCPAGYKDTGCSWTDGAELGGKQCVAVAGQLPENATPRPYLQANSLDAPTSGSECNPGNGVGVAYTRRVLVQGTWRCPPGFESTGCSWGDGMLGEKQCVMKLAQYATMIAPATSVEAVDNPIPA